jgi:hypothetical protein
MPLVNECTGRGGGAALRPWRRGNSQGDELTAIIYLRLGLDLKADHPLPS